MTPDQDGCIRAGVHRITGSCTLCGYGMAPDLPIPEAAREAIAEEMFVHRSMPNPRDPFVAHCGCGETFGTAVERQKHAADAVLAAALPHLRSLQVETQVEYGRALGRKEAGEEIAAAIKDEANWRFCEGEGRARYDSARIALEVVSQPQNATSDPRTDLPAGPSHPTGSGSRRKRYPHAHVCVTCSPDGLHPGPGCINCRETGWDQTPCQAEGHKPQCPHGCCDPLAPSHPQDSETAREAL